MGPHCLPYRLLNHFSRREKQTTFVAIGALRVKGKNRMGSIFFPLSVAPGRIKKRTLKTYRIHCKTIVPLHQISDSPFV